MTTANGRRNKIERNTIWFGLATIGILMVAAALLLSIGLVVAAAAFPIAVLALLLGALAWSAASGGLSRNDQMALAATVIVVAGAVPIALATNVWIGLAFAAGGLLFTGTVYGLSYAHSEPILEAGRERRRQVQTDIEALRHVDVFSGLSEPGLRAVAEIGERMHVPQGSRLASEGHVGAAFYVILQGQAQLSADSGVGRITVRVAGPGEAFPFAALFGRGMLITSAYAMTEMELWKVDRVALLTLCSQRPEVGLGIFRKAAEVLGERYRSTLTRLTERSEHALREADFWANV